MISLRVEADPGDDVVEVAHGVRDVAMQWADGKPRLVAAVDDLTQQHEYR